ncbi:signal peptide peptidase [Trifolium repens]|nr:signal peptide peptidase [Trifolium repens]
MVSFGGVYSVVYVFLFGVSFVLAGDIVHHDDVAPTRPGCENNFVLVKVPTWIDGVENDEYVGVGARFGPTLESKEKHANHTRVVIADPPDCCSKPKNKLTSEIILVHRGKCSFTTKANIADEACASAILIINYRTELFKMVCEENETDVDIGIPAVMLPQDAGLNMERHIKNNSIVSIQLYSPLRPLVDVAEVFLWLMAVGTILCASYWSAWTARETAIEQEKLLKDASDDYVAESVGSRGYVEISTTAAVLFVVLASCFLVMLYKLMSFWFLEVPVVLFCIGGIEGLQTCLVALLSCFRWFQHPAQTFVKIPFFGPVPYLTLAVTPFCVVFAVVWAVKRHASYAWIGQDILGIALIITVLQIVRIPNLKVGTVLLSCAFLYDIFWVFVSKWWFHESVMIVVARGDKSGEDGIPMLLKLPRLFDPWGGYSIIGFGDIILPVGARFGPTLESKEKHANHTRVVIADPPDCCSKPKNKLTSEIILVHRGKCSFTTKANIADEAGASAILIINYRTELFKMVCEENETDVDIGIPAVMLPQDAGLNMERHIKNNSIGQLCSCNYSYHQQIPTVSVLNGRSIHAPQLSMSSLTEASFS